MELCNVSRDGVSIRLKSLLDGEEEKTQGEDVSLLERCPHFRGCYVQSSMESGPEDASLLERCLHFRGC